MSNEVPKFNSTILIAPLDWGLGHATRCIPIVKALLQKRCRVVIAASGFHQILLQQEFPDVPFIHLDGYQIHYGKKNIMLQLLFQLPHFFKTIKKENRWLAQIIEENGINGVISDNRYGLFSKKVPCIFITHQLQPKLTSSTNWAEAFVRNRLYKFIEKFSGCWVADVHDKKNNLAGSLSHPNRLPKVPVTYIGLLSRFRSGILSPIKYKLTICLSGPEPQRTMLENLILPQLQNVQGPVLLIRGQPGTSFLPAVPAHVTVTNHLAAADMQSILLQSRFVLSRSGYSTLMDMQVLGCKCIYIPTPGQTEQEYLGNILSTQKIALVKKQAGFNLIEAISEAENFDFQPTKNYQNNLLDGVIENWLKEISAAQ